MELAPVPGRPMFPRHQREVDDGLRGARGFVALVDAHGPPEGNAFAGGDDVDEAVERREGDARFGGGVRGRKGRDEGGEGVVVRGVRGDEGGVHGAACDEEMGETVEEGEIALRSEGDVEGGGLGGLGGAGIDDDDLGLAAIHHDALPHDGVGDAGVGADENEGVALLEIGVGEGRGVEAEGLFVGDVRSGHALAGVAVAVEGAQAEFEEGAEERHLFGHDLAGAEEGDGVRAVVALDGLEAVRKRREGGGPVDGREWGAAGGAKERGGRAVGGGEGGEGFPAFGAGHAEVDGVVGIGGKVDGLALGIEVDAKRAAGGAEPRTVLVVATGARRAGTRPSPRPKAAGRCTSSVVIGPVRAWRRLSSAGSVFMRRVGQAFSGRRRRGRRGSVRRVRRRGGVGERVGAARRRAK